MLLRETAYVRLMGLRQIPFLLFLGPRVVRLDDEACEVMIPLRYHTRNHLKSMYIGALVGGADLAGGLLATATIRRGHGKVKLVFKDFGAEFLKRADGDTHFLCRQGREVAQAVEEADRTGERVNVPLEIVATVPSKYGTEPVAKFSLGLSLKRKD